MSKNVNVNAASQALNALLPSNIRNNAIIIPPPQPAKSLQEALDRGLSTFQHTTSTGVTYTLDVERCLRLRRRNKIENSKHKPRALEEPDQRDREGRLPPPPPPIDEEYIRRIDEDTKQYYENWQRNWEQEKAVLERLLRAGLKGGYTDSYWRAHDLEPPKKEEPKKQEHEEEEDEIDLGYSDTSDDSDYPVVTIDVE